MNPRAELEKRYPEADFSVYFRFLDGCRGATQESDRTNEHHICPRAQFPEYEHALENIITLYIDDHEHAHKLLGALVPAMKVNANARGYCGLTAEQRRAAGRKGALTQSFEHRSRAGAAGGRSNKENKTGFCAPEAQSKGRQKTEALKIGIHAAGVAAKGGRMGTKIAHHTRWHVNRNTLSVHCDFCMEHSA